MCHTCVDFKNHSPNFFLNQTTCLTPIKDIFKKENEKSKPIVKEFRGLVVGVALNM
jgi:hypothetical protein